MPERRLHETSLHELVLDVDHVRELFVAKLDGLTDRMDERDKRYEQRFTSMDEKTSLALNSSKEAVTKAETATEKRFEGVNEFRGALSDQANKLLPRAEAEARWKGFEDKLNIMKEEIQSLRESRSESGGEKIVFKERQASRQWMTGLVIVSGLSFVGLILAVLKLVLAK